jgi:hypothetical protein
MAVAAMSSRHSLPPPPPPRRASPRDCDHFVQLDEHGKLLSGHGRSEPLATVTAYASNVADAVGRLLQIGPFTTVRATLGRSAVMVLHDEGGRVVGCHAPDGAIPGLRTQPNGKRG